MYMYVYIGCMHLYIHLVFCVFIYTYYTYITLYLFSFWWFLVIRLHKPSSSFQPNYMCVNLALSILKNLYLVKIKMKQKR